MIVVWRKLWCSGCVGVVVVWCGGDCCWLWLLLVMVVGVVVVVVVLVWWRSGGGYGGSHRGGGGFVPPGSAPVFKSTSASRRPPATTHTRRPARPPYRAPTQGPFWSIAGRQVATGLAHTLNKVYNCGMMNLLDEAQRPPSPAVALGVQRVEATNLTQSMWPLWLCTTGTSAGD